MLREHERRKKQLYLRKCLDQRRHFNPYVVTADGALRKEVSAFYKALAHRLTKRCECLISRAWQFVTTIMSIAILRASNQCLRGSQVPAHTMSKRIPLWEDEDGLGLFFA